MAPSWTEKIAAGADFSDLFIEWEQQVAIYELQRQKTIDDDVKVAVVTRNSPPDVRMALRQAAHVYGDNYLQMMQVLEQYLKTGREYDMHGVAKNNASSITEPTPMDVGAAHSFGKSQKGKGKDFKDKPKGT